MENCCDLKNRRLFHCSECGYYIDDIYDGNTLNEKEYDINYCPQCGRKIVKYQVHIEEKNNAKITVIRNNRVIQNESEIIKYDELQVFFVGNKLTINGNSAKNGEWIDVIGNVEIIAE